MNQLSSIKERLKNLNDAEFQELCDCYLSLRNRGYKAYSRRGAHDTKQKTTTGTPDSFFLMPNGFYLFVESTTLEHKGRQLIKKLKKDISSSLDEKKTGISVNRIQEIVLCYNSNLTPKDLEEVNNEAVKVLGKLPMHNSLNVLAHEIFFHHKNLAHDYLGLPLDTGQVVSIDKFVEEYDNGKQKLATPLAGIFLHRVTELDDVLTKMDADDIVIISGPAGVGKSKLALAAIDRFLQSHLDYNAFAISPKGADILGDLGNYFKGDENSVLLVDDVYRVDKFDQILGFYHDLKRGTLKLILTVRDYALQNVKERLNRYRNSIVKVDRFTSDEINSIIEQKPFEVRNFDYQLKINAIANGNARLAVMMAKIARETNSLSSLNDVSDLFEQYFETFISENNALQDKGILKALGVLSFFNSLPFNNVKLLDSVAVSFSITSDELRNSFDVLHGLDLIELNYHHVKIGEQNLATYFFYKVFFKDRLLSFESLWHNYFERHERRFKDALFPIYQNFDKEYIMHAMRPTLLSYWSEIKVDELRAMQFWNFAWEVLPEVCLAYVEEKTSALELSVDTELKTEYKANDFTRLFQQEEHLKLLAKFFKDEDRLWDALDLSFQFTERKSQYLSELVYHLDENFQFTREDNNNHFSRQAILVDYLVQDFEHFKVIAFFAVSKKLLKSLRWSYKNSEETGGDDANIKSVKETRGKILSAICELYTKYPEEVFALLLNLSDGYFNETKYTIVFDLQFLIPWVRSKLKNSEFRHCFFVQDMIWSSRRAGVYHDDFNRLETSYSHPTYSIYKIVNWDISKGKEGYEFENAEEFGEHKRADIENHFTFNSIGEVEQFITQYREILQWDQIQLGQQFLVGETIIVANLKADVEIGFETFLQLAILQDEGPFSSRFFISYEAMDRLTDHPELTERFWGAIDTHKLSELWKIEVLLSLPEEIITQEHFSRLYDSLNGIERNFLVRLEQFKKYEKYDPKVLSEVLRIIVRKNESEGVKVSFWKDAFLKVCDVIGDVELLKAAYKQQDEINHHFDYDGSGFLKVVEKDNSFLLDHIKGIFKRDYQESVRNYKELSVVWKLTNAEALIDEVIHYMAGLDNQVYFSKNIVKTFFERPEKPERVEQYLLHLIWTSSNQPRIIRFVFDIINNSMRGLFDEAFVTYLKINQDLDGFKEIEWTNDQVLFPGDALVGSIRAAKWERLLKLVEKSIHRAKTRGIRNFIKRQRDNELLYAEEEKKRSFIGF